MMDIYGKSVSGVVKCKPGATVDGKIHLSRNADIFSAKVYKTESPTGTTKYEALGPDLFAGSILGYTGYNADISFVFTPSAIAGATAGDYYGIKFVATETGIFGTKAVEDIIVKIINNLEA